MINVQSSKNVQHLQIKSVNNASSVLTSNDSSIYYSNLAKNYSESAESSAIRAEEAIANIDTVTDNSLRELSTSKNNLESSLESKASDLEAELQAQIQNNNKSMQQVLTQTEAIAHEAENTLESTLKKNQITNCILEVPQRIKYTLENGVFTLKAGSVVIVPNGAGVFEEVVIESDLTQKPTGRQSGAKDVIFVTNNGKSFNITNSNTVSGATVPTGTCLWYDTTNNVVHKVNNGVADTATASFPLCIVQAGSDGMISSIDRVFNGIGYIGNHIWVDKGVKILVSNGLNEDGTINNFVMETPFLMSKNAALNGAISFIRHLGNSYQLYNIAQSNYLGELDYIPEITATFQWYFNTNEMKWYMHEASETKWKTAPYYNIAPVISATSTAITSFEPYKPFQAVNYSIYKADMDGKISKSGDTMNGNLTIKKVAPIIDCIGTNIDYTATTAPSSNIFASVFRSLDKNNQIMGQTFCAHTITNNVQLTSDVKRVINGAVKTASLSLIVDASGNPLFEFPKCTTMPTNGGASTAKSYKVAVVVENYWKNGSWYRVWSDGWKEQGGYIVSATSGATVSLLKGFTSTSYHVSAQAQITSATAPTPNQIITPYAYTTSNFKVALNYPMNFSWYACGY